jgi:SAM-dependent methyltransferase
MLELRGRHGGRPSKAALPVSGALRTTADQLSSPRLPHRKKISSATVRDDFNELTAVIHYTRAAHELGLWTSERLLIERFFPDRTVPLLEAGCGAGRVTLGLWALGYQDLTAFDFADELLDQARSLAAERHAEAIRFIQADATRLRVCNTLYYKPEALADDGENRRGDGKSNVGADAPAAQGGDGRAVAKASEHRRFGGALFMFNGLMQIPGRENRRAALRGLHAVCAEGAALLFTTHDRDASPTERALWRLETLRWERGEQDPRLVEFGDRYFEEAGTGRTFMHLPTRAEIMEDLASTGWAHVFDAMRSDLATEPAAVTAFSDECRFWAARRDRAA